MLAGEDTATFQHMKVFIISGEPFPRGMAATNRVLCYAKALVLQKIDCEVIIFQRNESTKKSYGNTLGAGCFDGVNFRYMGGVPFRDKNLFLRKFYDLVDKWKTLNYLKRNLEDGDVVIAFSAPNIHFVNRLIEVVHNKHAKFVRELCELPFGTGKETKKKIADREKCLKTQFSKYDGIFAISDTLSALAKHYISLNCKILKIPILVDFEKYALKNMSDDAEVPYIFHSGTLTEQKDGILGMIEAFGIVSARCKTNIHFISTGNLEKSPHAHEIKNLIKKYHLEDKLFFTGYLSVDELRNYLSKATLVIINKYPNQQNTYCFSTKLAEYLAAEKPVIITKVGEAMNWLKDGETAYVVSPTDISELADKIQEVSSNSSASRMIGVNGRELCKKAFDYRSNAQALAKFLMSL